MPKACRGCTEIREEPVPPAATEIRLSPAGMVARRCRGARHLIRRVSISRER